MFLEERILASVSGGRTSMFMLEWLLKNKGPHQEIKAVFANTSWEHFETIEFVNKCDKRWQQLYDFKLVWVEAVVNEGRVACTHKIVDYETCKKNKEVFSEMCSKYGIPNINYPHCTRELKENPIHDYMNNVMMWGKGSYSTAIGIRVDEPRRIKRNKTPYNKIYPLVDWHPDQPDKLDIIDWWEDQEFDLNIPEHLGNCVGCFKKSNKKLLKVIRDAHDQFDNNLEKEHGHVGPNKIAGEHVSDPRVMYRGYKTKDDLVELFMQTPLEYLKDDTEEVSEGCSSSCEPFAE